MFIFKLIPQVFWNGFWNDFNVFDFHGVAVMFHTLKIILWFLQSTKHLHNHWELLKMNIMFPLSLKNKYLKIARCATKACLLVTYVDALVCPMEGNPIKLKTKLWRTTVHVWKHLSLRKSLLQILTVKVTGKDQVIQVNIYIGFLKMTFMEEIQLDLCLLAHNIFQRITFWVKVTKLSSQHHVCLPHLLSWSVTFLKISRMFLCDTSAENPLFEIAVS